jgi:hypothetical protein
MVRQVTVKNHGMHQGPTNHPSLKSRLTQGETSDGKKPPCITVTGTVYSAVGSGTQDDPDGDGDLHFTLALDPAFTKYSVPNDCNPSKTGCTNIIVEVICHTQPLTKYITTWTDYCAGVPSKYPPKAFPRQGERLSVSGTFVNDDGKWNEIHPASDIHPFK